MTSVFLKVKTQAEAKAGQTFDQFQAITYREQVVAGMNYLIKVEKQGWRSGESARLPPMCPRFNSRTRRHMWVGLVVGSLLCSVRFFSGYSSFPLSLRTNIFQVPIRSWAWMHVHFLNEFLWTPWLNYIIIIIINYRIINQLSFELVSVRYKNFPCIQERKSWKTLTLRIKTGMACT